MYEAENIYEFPYMIYEKIMPTNTEFFKFAKKPSIKINGFF